MKLPQTFYFAATTFGDLGLGMAADLTPDMDKALDAALYSNGGPDFRLFRVDMYPDNNLPECIRDITEDAIMERNQKLISLGREPLEGPHVLSNWAAE